MPRSDAPARPEPSPSEPSLPAPPLVAVVGATATGKSDLALALAEGLGGEIVNADALQLYRGMDIGTAKVGPAERSRVPHHLLDVLDVTQEASVSAYQRAARDAVAAIRARGRLPIVVGGSGLYVRALLDDIRFPPTDPEVRAHFEQRVAAEGADALHAELTARDPEAAAVIGASDARRIVRALEVGELTGGSFRAFLPRPHHVDPTTLQIGLAREREDLRERVAVRVGRMVSHGLLEEVRTLRAQGLDRGTTARRAIGYEQALAVLDGSMGCEEAISSTITGTRRLVRKQDTWFRRDERVTWLPAADGDLVARARDLVVRRLPGADA